MGLLSTSCAASVLMAAYVLMACVNLYRLMYPMTFVDLTPFDSYVNPWWETAEPLQMKVYLSSKPKFDRSFLQSEFAEEEDSASQPTVLLWQQDIREASLSKSVLLTTLDCSPVLGESSCSAAYKEDASLQYATEWLDNTDQALRDQEGGLLAALAGAGQGIESTSILLTLYQKIMQQLESIFGGDNHSDNTKNTTSTPSQHHRTMVHLSPQSPVWTALSSNITVHVHVVVLRQNALPATPPTSADEAVQTLGQASRSHSLLAGTVELVKFEPPNHLSRPGRLLYKDVVYVLSKLVQQDTSRHPPWDMEYTQPEYFAIYSKAQAMKEAGQGYPYWKPEVSIKYVMDTESYPLEMAHVAGMELVRVPQSQQHPTGIVHVPNLYVDEIGLTSEKYIPLNETITSLPLHISFDRSDSVGTDPAAANSRRTATDGSMSPARWRLLTHLSQSIEAQKELGFEQSDIDDLRRLIADTNVTLLGITVLASALHLLFEFLTFKNEVSFWRNNTDLTGLSVRSLFLDMIGQVVIVLFLIEKDSSLLMTVPSAFGCLIALWKCQRATGLTFLRVAQQDEREVTIWNRLPRLLGYELRAVRLEQAESKRGDPANSNTASNAQALTLECDRLAARKLGVVMVPLVVLYTLYSFFTEKHSGWYSWLITSASSAVYALGFVLMTPQLFLNYKMKSVAHLPWRVLVYKSLNTFIDDLFSFIIRMPTMARISCFRDDVVFFIYLYQRWLYPVDMNRPVEGGGDGVDSRTQTMEAKKNQ